jgi:hypothetical protein
VNGDIVLTEEAVDTMRAVSAAIRRREVDRRVLVFGRRFNVNMTEVVADLEHDTVPLTLPVTTPNEMLRLHTAMARRGTLFIVRCDSGVGAHLIFLIAI